jgi:hypothetical protein
MVIVLRDGNSPDNYPILFDCRRIYPVYLSDKIHLRGVIGCDSGRVYLVSHGIIQTDMRINIEILQEIYHSIRQNKVRAILPG